MRRSIIFATAIAVLAGATAFPAWAQSPYRAFVPAGNGPFPATIFLSGCSGLVEFGGVNTYVEKAEELRAAGQLVVFVDYLGKRGLKSCTAAGRQIHDEAAGDAIEAMAWLRGQKNVDPTRISVVGWSYGGGVVLSLLRQLPAGQPGLWRAVMIYPDCRPLQASKAAVPALMLTAALDTVAPPSRCADAARMLPAGTLRSISYDNAYHGFDARGLPAKTQYALGTIGYNEAAANAAWAEIKAFLK